MAMTRKLWSINGLATELGRDRRTIAKALETIPPDGDIRGARAWHMATATAALIGPPSAERLDPNQERARKDRALADKTEMENEKRRGELVEVAEVASQWMKSLSIVRTRLLAIPSKAAANVPHEARGLVFKLVEQEIHSALTELSRSGDDEEADAERDAVEAKAPRSRRNRPRSEGAEK